MTVREIYDLIQAFAPFETQAEYDNSGLLVGSPSQEVKAVLFALDVTESVISEAVFSGASLFRVPFSMPAAAECARRTSGERCRNNSHPHPLWEGLGGYRT